MVSLAGLEGVICLVSWGSIEMDEWGVTGLKERTCSGRLLYPGVDSET